MNLLNHYRARSLEPLVSLSVTGKQRNALSENALDHLAADRYGVIRGCHLIHELGRERIQVLGGPVLQKNYISIRRRRSKEHLPDLFEDGFKRELRPEHLPELIEAREGFGLLSKGGYFILN